MLRMTIFAARRVLPPLLMTPAKASKPFMKLTGPLAMPPPERRFPAATQRGEVRAGAGAPLEEHAFGARQAHDRFHGVVDTELMKQAEHCGLDCTPTLNHTGELKLIFCSTKRWVSSSRKASRDSLSAK